jgi:hypothetical protein
LLQAIESRAEIKFDLKLLLPLRIEEEEVCRVEATTTDFTDEMACIVLEFRVVFSVEGEQRRY